MTTPFAPIARLMHQLATVAHLARVDRLAVAFSAVDGLEDAIGEAIDLEMVAAHRRALAHAIASDRR